MNESQQKKFVVEQTVVLQNRRQLCVKGITDIISFDEFTITLMVDSSMLSIYGEGMHIPALSIEAGTIEIEGKINAIEYSDGKGKSNNKFWKRWEKKNVG